jgi:hypothetical protein
VSTLFGLTPLPPALLGALLAIVVTYALATEAAKGWFFNWLDHRPARPRGALVSRVPIS